jgi:exoribonuclease R
MFMMEELVRPKLSMKPLKTFLFKMMGEMNILVSCHIMDATENNVLWIHQPRLPKNLTAYLKESIGDMNIVFKTALAPKTLNICPNQVNTLI